MAAIWILVSVLLCFIEKGTSQATFGENDVNSLNSQNFVDSCIVTEVESSVRKIRFTWTLEWLSNYFRNDGLSENYRNSWEQVAERQFSEPSGANWNFNLMTASNWTQRPQKIIISFTSHNLNHAYPALTMKATAKIGRGNSSVLHAARMFTVGDNWSGEFDIPVSAADWIGWRKSLTMQLELDLMTVSVKDREGMDTVCKIPTVGMLLESSMSSAAGFAGATKMLDPFSYSDE